MNKYIVLILLWLLASSPKVYAVQGKKVIGYDKLINPFERAQNSIPLQPQENYMPNPSAKIISVKVNYIELEEAKDWMEKLFPEIETGFLKQKNIIVLKGAEEDLLKAKKVILSLDKAFKKLNIEVKIVEVSSRDLKEIGFEWPNLSKGIPFKIKDGGITSEDTISSLLRGLEGKGKAKIIARPSISTLDNHQAVIKIGDKIPYAKPVENNDKSTRWVIEYIEAGVKLFITPQIVNSRTVKVKIETEVSSIKEFITTPYGDYPIISNRFAQSEMEAEDGKTIVIGGLISSEEKKNLSKVPLISKIPIIGSLFKREKKEKAESEILFFITPKILL